MRRTLYWHHPGQFILIISPIIYIIVALCVRKSGRFSFALCQDHRAKRRNGMLTGWAMVIGGIGGSIMVGQTRNFEMIILGSLLAIAGLVVVVIQHRVVSPQRIERGYLWVKGAGKGFLSRLSSVG